MGKRLIFGEVKKFVEENSECRLLSTEYINNSTNLKFSCKCGNEFEAKYSKFRDRDKRQCNTCGLESRVSKRKLSLEYVKNFVETESNSGCELINKEYLNELTKMKFKCNCGKIFETTFLKFKGRGKMQCRGCGIGIRASIRTKTHEQFAQEIFDLVGKEYTVMGEYVRDDAKIKMRHNVCGYEYEVTPSNILKDRRCPACKSSKGEVKIANWLNENGIDYGSEYSFDDLVSELRNPLRFDFAIFDNCKNIKCLIEFQGGQHYEWVKGWQTEGNFIKAQYHDELKRRYCENSNIELVVIPYYEFDNIENILKRAIN